MLYLDWKQLFQYCNHPSTVAITVVARGVTLTNAPAALATITHPRLSFLLFLIDEILFGTYFPAVGIDCVQKFYLLHYTQPL